MMMIRIMKYNMETKDDGQLRGKADSELYGDKVTQDQCLCIYSLILWSTCLMEIQDGQKCDFVFC